jgi:tetratricopeptide (TPR) repeat protein
MSKEEGLDKLDCAAQPVVVRPTVVLTETSQPPLSHIDEGEAADHTAARSPAFSFGYGKHICIGIVLLLLFAWGVSVVQKRSAEENLFRKYVDEAQLIDLKNGRHYGSPGEKNPHWKEALEAALQLGENKRILADLYVKAACAELPDKQRHSNERADLEKAVSLYAQIPNTVSQQIKTIDLLACVIMPPLGRIASPPELVPEFSNDRYPHAEEDVAALDRALKNNQLPTALALARLVPKSALQDRLKTIASRLTVNDPLLHVAMPIFEDCVYYCSSNIEILKDEYLVLDETQKKDGCNTHDYLELVKLVHKAENEKDYHGAFIYLQRCLGDHDDASLKKELLKVRQSIALSDYKVGTADLAECMDMLETLRALQSKEFGETSKHVLTAERKICYVNALRGNFDEALRLLERCVAKSPDADKVFRNDTDELIYDMAGIYSAEGDCNSAILLLKTRIGYRSEYYLTVQGIVNEAALYFQSGRYDKALLSISEARKIVHNDSLQNFPVFSRQ